MLIVRGDAQTLPSELNKAATGEVWFDPIVQKTDGVDVGTVVFSPNGRTVWHQHEHGQLLQITSGFGFVCKEGEAPQRVRAGDTVWIAPNKRHWHGATASTLMSHTTTTIGATEFREAVTEAEYAAASGTGQITARSAERSGCREALRRARAPRAPRPAGQSRETPGSA
jgi:quercetin dioxygenase-like cupin family protein